MDFKIYLYLRTSEAPIPKVGHKYAFVGPAGAFVTAVLLFVMVDNIPLAELKLPVLVLMLLLLECRIIFVNYPLRFMLRLLLLLLPPLVEGNSFEFLI